MPAVPGRRCRAGGLRGCRAGGLGEGPGVGQHGGAGLRLLARPLAVDVPGVAILLRQLDLAQAHLKRVDRPRHPGQFLAVDALLVQLGADRRQDVLECLALEAGVVPAEIPEPLGIVLPAALVEGAQVGRILPRAEGQVVGHVDVEGAAEAQQLQAGGHHADEVRHLLQHVVGDDLVEAAGLERDRAEAGGLHREPVLQPLGGAEVDEDVRIPARVDVDVEVFEPEVLAGAEVQPGRNEGAVEVHGRILTRRLADGSGCPAARPGAVRAPDPRATGWRAR